MDTIKLAKKIRIKSLQISYKSKNTHLGSILSIVDIISVLYGNILNINKKNYKSKTRNRFILSKGHAGMCVYIALYHIGLFSLKKLNNYCKNNSCMTGHISNKNIPGIEFSTGSLGHGLSVAVGMSIAAIIQKSIHKIYVLIGDGECNEGSIWESIMFASQFKCKNLIAIIDYNKYQGLGKTEEILNLEPLKKKIQSFNWNVFEVNGHNHEKLEKILKKNNNNNYPTCIIAHTIKGKGVSFMENKNIWHYKKINEKELKTAILEIRKKT